MSFDNNQHFTRIRTAISKCTLLKQCTWDFEYWYRDILQLFEESFSSKEQKWFKACIWYSMTEYILYRINADNNLEMCRSLLKDLKDKLGETQTDTDLILRQVMNKSILYQQITSDYGFDGGITKIGYHWASRQKKYTQKELFALSENALPFWVFHKAYAVRFAECWAEYHHASNILLQPSWPTDFSLEYLLKAANYLAMNSSKPLFDLLVSPTISGTKRGYCVDKESLFFSLLKSGVPYEQAAIITKKNSRLRDYGPQILTTLKAMPLETSTRLVLAGGRYLPPREAALRKVLQLIELY